MSFLYPLFLLALGGLAVPVVLHLARRRTRREIPFSSLRFLDPSPPKFESRRRIENWLLLVLRCLAIALLAGAFARPLFTRPLPGMTAAEGRRLLVLVDTSASMRREGLWSQAVTRVRGHLDGAATSDRVALLAFDRRTRPLIRFEEWAEATASARAGLIAARLEAAAPTWAGTDLGAALVGAAEALLDDEASRRGGPAIGEQVVVLVSDLQQGSRLSALGASDWPPGVRLVVDPVADPASAGAGANLGLAAVAEAPTGVSVEQAAPKIGVRVLASGEPGSRGRGSLRWETGPDGGAATARPLEVELTAGESRVLRVAGPAVGPGGLSGVLALTGDPHPFDNRLAVAPSIALAVEVLYLGNDDGKDPGGPLYFLERALPATRSRAPRITALRPGAPGAVEAIARAHLVVVTGDPPPATVAALKAHLERGRTLLTLPTGAGGGQLLGALTGASGNLALREAPPGREVVLTELDLGDPVLAPFADGRFSDFTKVRFWKRRLLDPRPLPGARVLARFDDGSPAWVTARVGRGLLWVMTSSWHPADSQLALSSKFVPLLWSLLESSAGLGSGQAQFFVGDEVGLPPWAVAAGAGLTVRTPAGTRTPLPAGAAVFAGTDEPGLYALEAPGQPALVFAVNLPPPESVVVPMPVEQLERLGIQLAETGTAAQASATRPVPVEERRRRSAFFLELEAQQRTWRWLLAAALLVLVAETLLAGRLRRPTRSLTQTAEEVP